MQTRVLFIRRRWDRSSGRKAKGARRERTAEKRSPSLERGISSFFIEVGKGDDRVEEDYCHGPECVVAQKPPAEGKDSCPEGDVGEKEAQGRLDRVT